MGLLSFIKGVGEKVFKKQEIAAAPTPDVKSRSK